MGPDGTRLRGIAKASDDTILVLRPEMPLSKPSQSLIERDHVPGGRIGPALATPLDKDAGRRKAPESWIGPPLAELREHGYELDRGFGQAVARSLAGSRVLAGEQSRLDQSLESVGQDI
jgi:hypothetical protein